MALLDISGAQMAAALKALAPEGEGSSVSPSPGRLDASLLGDGVDSALLGALVPVLLGGPDQQETADEGCEFDFSHNDLSSGTKGEERIFQLWKLQKETAAEKNRAVGEKAKSGKEKDFAVAAAKRNKAQEQIDTCESRLAHYEEELVELEEKRKGWTWFVLLTRWQEPGSGSGANRVHTLRLGDCGLGACALTTLVTTLLTFEQTGAALPVRSLNLDGNELRDESSEPLVQLLKLSGALTELSVRNVGIGDIGLSVLLSGLVKNEVLDVLDLRQNGKVTPETGEAAVGGMRHFNKRVQIRFP